jgi:hypothetical protein
MSETTPKKGQAVGSPVVKDEDPTAKPLGDSWVTGDPADATTSESETDSDGKATIRPLGDSWVTSEPATSEAK